jgi:hypothetical protein
VDQDRIRQAKLTGATARLRDLTLISPDAYRDLRRVWPEIADQIDRLIELVAWDEPTAE